MGSKGLRRELGYSALYFANIAGIFGSVWLFAAFYAATIAGPASIVAWVIGAVCMVFLVLVYAELGGMLPQPGAVVRFPDLTHGTLVSFAMSWAVWLGYATVAPLEAESSVQYASYYVNGLSAHGTLTGEGLACAVVLVGIFFVLNYFGVRLMAQVNSWVTAIKMLVPVLTIVAVLAVGVHMQNLTAYGGFAPAGFKGVLYAVSAGGIALAYTGFRQALEMAGEARNPGRDVPRAVIAAFFTAMVLYLLLQFVFVTGLTGHALAHGWAALSLSSPFANLAAAINLGWLATILLGDSIVSPSATGIIFTATTSRVVMAMEANGYLPKKLGTTHPRYQVPTPALWVNLVAGLLFLVPYQGWEALVGIVSSATILSYSMAPVSTHAMRLQAPGGQRPFRLRGLNAVAPIAFVITSLLVLWSGWPLVGQLMIAMAAGFILYGYYYVRHGLPREHLRSGLWFIGYLAFLGVMSWLGSFGSGASVVPYPFDMVVVAAGAVGFYYWGLARRLTSVDDQQLLQVTALDTGAQVERA